MPSIPKEYYFIGIAAFLIVLLIVIIAIRNRRSKRAEAFYEENMPEATPETSEVLENTIAQKPEQGSAPANPYQAARSKAFNANSPKPGSDEIFQVIMDWDLGSGNIITLVAAATGEAHLHFSNGATIAGTLNHENVSRAAKSFVEKAGEYLPKTLITNTARLPEADCVTFYLLTGQRRYGAQEKISKFYDDSSTWQHLFNEGENVIAELQALNEAEGQG